ncbi:MAG TPA: hypothetical protein VL404_09510 [Candidatus Eisenbacteria bacterium]|nr:hypothetical protein [Candidatus Eisenbacteria bacterium]
MKRYAWILAATALFAACALPVHAEDKDAAKPDQMTNKEAAKSFEADNAVFGTVTATQDLSAAEPSITVKTAQGDEKTLQVDPQVTKLFREGKEADWKDLKTGESVRATTEKRDGKWFALSIQCMKA